MTSTADEAEILALFRQGMSRETIAKRLGITVAYVTRLIPTAAAADPAIAGIREYVRFRHDKGMTGIRPRELVAAAHDLGIVPSTTIRYVQAVSVVLRELGYTRISCGGPFWCPDDDRQCSNAAEEAEA